MELLVVISLIVLLVTMSLAGISYGKVTASSAKCQNNLRQLALGMKMYVNETGHFPATQGAAAWLQASDSNFVQVTSCPKRIGVSYSINRSGSGGRVYRPSLGLGVIPGEVPIAETAIKVPSDMIAILDHVEESFPPLSRPAVIIHTNYITYPHNGRLNLTFCDGHIEQARDGRLTAPSDVIRRRWNNDNEPHLETWR